MFAFALALSEEAAAAGRIFTVPAPWLPWLPPVCILAGVAVQIAALALLHARGRPLNVRAGVACAAGALLVFAGAALDRDVTVAVGEALALLGAWFAWRRG